MIEDRYYIEPAVWSVDWAPLKAVRTAVFIEEQQIPEAEEWDEDDSHADHALARTTAGEPIEDYSMRVATRWRGGSAARDEGALYVLGYLQGNKIGGYCTGFAIKPDTIATNAHCVAAYRTNGGTPVVTQNDSNGKVRFKIVAAQMNPGYKAQSQSADSPDVGLMRIDGKMPKTVTIASEAELRSLGPGDDVFVLGFPGRVMHGGLLHAFLSHFVGMRLPVARALLLFPPPACAFLMGFPLASSVPGSAQHRNPVS